jgi:hypothetical protein
MNGMFCDFHSMIQQLMPFAKDLIVPYYHKVHKLSQEIILSQDATGMQHKILHHFVQSLCHNGLYGFTHNTLYTFLILIRDLRRYPQHATQSLPSTFHYILSTLSLADITHSIVLAITPSQISVLTAESPLLCAVQMRP